MIPKMGSESVHSDAVLGIDAGFSERRKTTCFCLLRWSSSRVEVAFAPSGSDEAERRSVLRALVPSGTQVACVAIDGPLVRDLRHIDHYRSAEAFLSRGEVAPVS